MQFKSMLQRKRSEGSTSLRKHTPWLSGPLAHDEHDEHDEHGHHGGTHEKHNPEEPLFKRHHESSTVELFYDLFFVANLATFTIVHEMVNAATVKSYLGFFSLLWFTWLQTSLFDVRFASDSVFNRICKAISFGVMTGFAVCGATYDTTNVVGNLKAFRAMALILMVSRLCLIVQYGVVLCYVKKYPRTYVPLLATMGALFISALVFFGTFFGFKAKDTGSSSSAHNSNLTYVAWYVVVCAEAAAVIAISCLWRVVSFKRTHLVERIGLLTLIIMGEGILGMAKSVAKILQTSNSTSSRDVGVVIASVLIIYFIWVLYFDQIEHDRFGTVRQQIWAILHFPLHVAILFTVEGGANLIIWNIIAPLQAMWWYNFPIDYDGSRWPEEAWKNASSLSEWANSSVVSLVQLYKKEYKLRDTYDYSPNITAIAKITIPLDTDEGLREAYDICYDMWTGISNAVFDTFGVAVPDSVTKKTKGDEIAKSDSLFEVFNTVFTYYYIAAGVFLVMLAVMYWFGKTKKSASEWVSMAVRTVFGIGLTMVCVALYYGDVHGAFMYSPWHLPLVMLVYFVVIIFDNILVWHGNRTIAQQTSTNRGHHRDIEGLTPFVSVSAVHPKGSNNGSESSEITPLGTR